MWQETGRPWLLGKRVAPWSGDTGGAGEPLPAGVQLFVASDADARAFRLWAYPALAGRHNSPIVVPFSAIEVEGGLVTLPTGRIDTTGDPVVTLHDGMIKVWGILWDGDRGKNNALYRMYTWIYWQ